MARAKAQGKRVSRPRLPQSVQDEIAELYGQEKSINQIRKELGVSYGSVWNYVQKLEPKRINPKNTEKL